MLREFADALESRPVDRGPNVLDLSFLEPNPIRTLPAVGIAGGIVDLHFVEARRQGRDIGQAVKDSPVLQFRDRSRNKNPEMPDVRIQEIRDPLASPLQVLGILVDDGNPSHCLMGRSDVVAGRGKDDDRIVDSAQISKAAFADAECALFQPIADEQVSNDGENLFAAQEVETAPPTFEPEKALTLKLPTRISGQTTCQSGQSRP